MTEESMYADQCLEYVLSMLPRRILHAVQGFRNSSMCDLIEEIRLRRDKYTSITSCGKNYILNYACTSPELERTLSAFCDGSLYAHSETIKSGYIILKNGIRVGVCGRASYSDGKMIGISDISSMCIRIPHKIECDCGPVIEEIRSSGNRGVLIYSPPGEGKTTLLRSVSRFLASGKTPLRVVVIDTRGELGYTLDDKYLCIDILSGYSKSEGITIASQTMSAEIIVCDEIGGYDEAQSIIMAHNCGIPLIASAHASGISELIKKPSIEYMHRAGIFHSFIGIKRKHEGNGFDYLITRDGAI